MDRLPLDSDTDAVDTGVVVARGDGRVRAGSEPAGTGTEGRPVEEVGRRPRVLAVTPRSLTLVTLGGAAGALTRYGMSQALPVGRSGWAALPVATLTTNLLGAFALDGLLALLAGRRPWLRLLLGTGFLGGFTTYSALSVETMRLLASGQAAPAVAYAAGSAVLGVLACVGGVAAGSALRGRR